MLQQKNCFRNKYIHKKADQLTHHCHKNLNFANFDGKFVAQNSCDYENQGKFEDGICKRVA